MKRRPVILVENDPFPRLLRAFLASPDDPEETAALADFVAHGAVDYGAWIASARKAAAGAYPADVRLVDSAGSLREQLPEADAVAVESLPMGATELACAPRLQVVQKYGTVVRNIDEQACRERGIPVLTLRRRANIACAEHAYALLLALTRRITATNGLVSMEALRSAGYAPGLFDTRHAPNSNWARIGGLRTLFGCTAGIIGFGEIGREVALRAAAFGLDVVYHQRTPLGEAEALQWQARPAPLEALLGCSDVVFVTLPGNDSTWGLLGGRELGQMKPGALLVNVSRARIVERSALLAALRSGRLGGLDWTRSTRSRGDRTILCSACRTRSSRRASPRNRGSMPWAISPM